MSIPVSKKAFTRFSEVKLDSLLEVTKAINNNHSIEQLFEIFTDILQNKLRISKFILFINEHSGWRCALKNGVEEDDISINVERDLLPIKEINAVNFPANTPINFHENTEEKNIFEIVIPVYHKTFPLAYLLIGDSDDTREIISPSLKHLNFIQTLASIIVVAIENKKLAKENIRQAAVKKELELASHMQAMLFPRTLPSNQKIDSAAYYLPHQQVGGDYYDFIWLNENELAFCVADVSGKGVSAALLMSNFQANLRILINHTNSLVDLVKQLNCNVMSNAKGEKFITFFIAKYNFKSRVLTYVNAAHNPPLMLNGTNVVALEKGCTGLGMFDEIPCIEEGSIVLNEASTIMCYTDGLTELENEEGEEFGMERLVEVLKKFDDSSMANLNAQIMNEAINHKKKQPYIDDIALFSIKLY
jgi:sigma-B regulation protein RsbU (phosphoserine phosphatase)